MIGVVEEKMKFFVAAWLALGLGVVFAGCATKTEIPVSWRDTSWNGAPFQRVLVLGVGEDETRRRFFEDRFAAALVARGASASASYTMLPETDALTEGRIREAVDGGGFDALIVSRLLGVEHSETYVPPRTYTVPTTSYGYYGYYRNSWDVVHEPGYVKKHQTVRVETNLYAASSGEIVWSGQSETMDPSSIPELADSVITALTKRLEAEALIP